MYLLFNDLIYTLICEEREGLYRRSVQPHYHFLSSFTITKVIHMLELPKHFSDVFLSQLPLQSFSGPLKTVFTGSWM